MLVNGLLHAMIVVAMIVVGKSLAALVVAFGYSMNTALSESLA